MKGILKFEVLLGCFLKKYRSPFIEGWIKWRKERSAFRIKRQQWARERHVLGPASYAN